MLCQSAAQCGLEGLAGINETPSAIKGVNTLNRWRYFLRKWVSGACLEFLNQLRRERLIELEEEVVFVTH